jgi:DNA modification methylase
MNDDYIDFLKRNVGSTGYQAIKMGRKFVGSELKQSYFTQACKNIQSATSNQADMFSYA